VHAAGCSLSAALAETLTPIGLDRLSRRRRGGAQATPLVLEAAEFCAAEGTGAFWSFVERADATLNLSPAPTDDCRGHLLHVASAGELVLSPGMASMLNVSLSMRQYSPKVQMLRMLAEQDAPGALRGVPPRCSQSGAGAELVRLLPSLVQCVRVAHAHTLVSSVGLCSPL